MAKPTRKTGGKSKAQLQEESELPIPDEGLEAFVREMHGSAEKPQDGMPTREYLKEQFGTKSAAVRYLINQGFEVKAIAKHLDMRYQHVRYVATTELKRGPNEDWRKPLLEGSTIPNPKQFKPGSD
mgnify:CR=1 FL=1